MIIRKAHLPRRTVLRGVGATIALPLLDSMVPALTAVRATAAAGVRRFGAIYFGMGTDMKAWAQHDASRLQMNSILSPLEPFRDRVIVATGLDNHPGIGADGGIHPKKQTAWLTASAARPTEGVDIRAGVSLDQIIAERIGGETRLASLELAIEATALIGSCSVGYSCAYNNTIAWRTPTLPLPMENNPRRVFERLFGATGSTDARSRELENRIDRSVLDSVLAAAGDLRRRVGPGDATRVAEYLDAIRDVERQVQKAEAQVARELPVVARPAGIPGTFGAHVKLMFDLQTLAFQTDVTRVFTFLVVRESSQRSYPEIGVPDAHHSLSHHQKDPAKLAKLAKISTYEMQLLAYFLERLQSAADGDGTVLDRTLLLVGSGMSDPDTHIYVDVPTVVVAGRQAGIAGNRHVKYPEHTPLANFQIALADTLDVPLTSFGESTGRVSL